MIIFGLTGSIGMGKTTVGKMLMRLGCPVHDSDLSVKKALDPYGKGFEAVALTFPKVWDKKKHVIKKDVLSQIIFGDSKEREKLEHILHPIVRQEQKNFIFKHKKLGVHHCALDIPLLFETGAQKNVDYTIVVNAPYFIQAQRVLARKNMTQEKFERILEAQMPNDQKCALADFVVHTGLGKAYSMKQVQNILKRVTR